MTLLFGIFAFTAVISGGDARASGHLSVGVRVHQERYQPLVPVTKNSRALTPAEQAMPDVVTMMERCITAAGLMGSKAAARIDCRADEEGVLQLFDVNLKPNLTGAGRPGRDDQDSLTMIAARALGWSYGDLLEEVLSTAWRD